MAPMSIRSHPGLVRRISPSCRRRWNTSRKSASPFSSGSSSSGPYASCASSTSPNATTPPPIPLPARTCAIPRSSPSAIMAFATRLRSRAKSCWRAVTMAAGTIPSAASVPVYLPLQYTAAQTASP
eukprot:2559650-Pleurochrysis_carterae.AAC.1